MPARQDSDSDKKTFFKQGLTATEASRRLQRSGPNEIEHKREYSVVKLFLSQFTSPLIYILVIAGVITWWLGEYIDSGVIWVAVVINTILGFWQEFKAARALEALREFLHPTAKVIRDGERKSVPLAEVVIGDVCVLEAGESVPADGVVVEGKDLTVNEAILTGESAPVKKLKSRSNQVDDQKQLAKLDNKYKVFMGTMVETGVGLMLVAGTGVKTEMGKIAASLVETKEEKTPLQQRLTGLSRTLALVVFGAVILILVIGLLRGHAFIEMFETAVAVAVAAIPEGLVVGLTVILSLGMQRILKRKALVRKLVAAETLGGVNVICADKTGTLTKGKMRVIKAEASNKQLKRLIQAAVLCNDQRDPLEVTMLSWAKGKLGRAYEKVVEQYPRVDGIPFSSERKYIATLHQSKHGAGRTATIFLSGAPEVVLARSRLSIREKEKWSEALEQLGDKGYRLVGFAYKETSNKQQATRKKLRAGELERMRWLGLLAFEDPVRAGAGAALKAARQAGISIKVITGDYRGTALAVLKRLKLYRNDLGEEEVMDGEELRRLTSRELKRRVGSVKLYVRTTPAQKLKIVEALQANGDVVAMTGDGVNDAPALKRADIGIVVNEASDVSKEAADMVLLDSNFNTIVEAVREGRVIYEAVRKVIVYLLADSFSELILVMGSLLLRLPLPITAVQILWVNLIEDSLPSLALAFERDELGLMKEAPRRRSGSLLDKEMKVLIFVIGLASNLLFFGLFLVLYHSGLPLELVRTFVFVGLGSNSLLYVFSVKTLRRNIWQVKILDNRFLLVAVAVGAGMLISAVHWEPLQKVLSTQALTLTGWGLLLAFGLVQVVAIEGVKYAFLRRGRKN